mmetsp:Transcript_21304/g.39750  ORF Transcript_21304/g.39750 Transcript_21304/m.39750 type:complete len:202 (+) Transcript_21304:391-996(+)
MRPRKRINDSFLTNLSPGLSIQSITFFLKQIFHFDFPISRIPCLLPTRSFLIFCFQFAVHTLICGTNLCMCNVHYVVSLNSIMRYADAVAAARNKSFWYRGNNARDSSMEISSSPFPLSGSKTSVRPPLSFFLVLPGALPFCVLASAADPVPLVRDKETADVDARTGLTTPALSALFACSAVATLPDKLDAAGGASETILA